MTHNESVTGKDADRQSSPPTDVAKSDSHFITVTVKKYACEINTEFRKIFMMPLR